jgi:predicted Rossmann-fold nucleotide-binding protein
VRQGQTSTHLAVWHRLLKRLFNFEMLVEEGTISSEDLALLSYADDPQVMWDGIRAFYDMPDKPLCCN